MVCKRAAHILSFSLAPLLDCFFNEITAIHQLQLRQYITNMALPPAEDNLKT